MVLPNSPLFSQIIGQTAGDCADILEHCTTSGGTAHVQYLLIMANNFRLWNIYNKPLRVTQSANGTSWWGYRRPPSLPQNYYFSSSHSSQTGSSAQLEPEIPPPLFEELLCTLNNHFLMELSFAKIHLRILTFMKNWNLWIKDSRSSSIQNSWPLL